MANSTFTLEPSTIDKNMLPLRFRRAWATSDGVFKVGVQATTMNPMFATICGETTQLSCRLSNACLPIRAGNILSQSSSDLSTSLLGDILFYVHPNKGMHLDIFRMDSIEITSEILDTIRKNKKLPVKMYVSNFATDQSYEAELHFEIANKFSNPVLSRIEFELSTSEFLTIIQVLYQQVKFLDLPHVIEELRKFLMNHVHLD